MSTFNLADLFELVVDVVPQREAIVTAERRLTYAELDERANRFANHLLAAGIQYSDHVGLELLNGTEYLEAMLGCYKARAASINVNYRYVKSDLAYLFDDADLVGLVYHRQFGPRVAAAAAELPKLSHFVVVDDGSGADAVPGSIDYEAALTAAGPERPAVGERTADDHYVAYTGGTTGMPKGVVWRQEDIFFAAMGGGDPAQSGNPVSRPEELAERVQDVGLVSLHTPPLMHVSAQWGALIDLLRGGKVVLSPQGRFDADAIWALVGAEKVNVMTIVGDAMARPLIDALAVAGAAGRPFDVSSLLAIGSGGAVLSSASKARIGELLPDVIVVDAFGSSETGLMGSRAGAVSGPAGGSGFTVNEHVMVLGNEGRPVEPGSGVVGRLARRGRVPLGYYKDEAKTESTFMLVDGVRWVLSGDMATVDSDGTVVMLGRGSTSINTGGEKVYPEEVEVVLRAHPDVDDAVVVGVIDDQWGERVVAVVQPRAGAKLELQDVQEFCRKELAGYKVPRQLCLVGQLLRSPTGKPDYRWARDTATGVVTG